jgi:anti-sigma factor RsiW
MELTCQELVELVTEYLEESLSPEDRLRFEEHLEECGNCTRYVNQIRRTKLLTGRLLEDAVQPSEKQKLLAVFEDWKKSR